MTNNQPTLQEMSDYLAEKLMGWHQEGDEVGTVNWERCWADKIGRRMFEIDGSYLCDSEDPPWMPHEDISQCFEYIIPRMQRSGFYFEIFHDLMTWTCRFSDTEGRNFYNNSHPYNTSNPAAAIVEAAYKAISAQEGE